MADAQALIITLAKMLTLKRTNHEAINNQTQEVLEDGSQETYQTKLPQDDAYSNENLGEGLNQWP